MKNEWLYHECDLERAAQLSKETGTELVTAKILLNRGINTKEAALKFLFPKLSELPDPFLIPNMKKGVERIISAVQNNEKMAIFGDYDTDGVSATALLINFFKKYHIDVERFIPNRTQDGYGLSKKGIDRFKNKNVKLIITVDNGTSAVEEIKYANSLNIDTIITDHHEVPPNRPEAFAIINPKLVKDSPFSELAGVGVAFYLAAAVKIKLRASGAFSSIEPDMKEFLDLVAIGTVADVAPLTGINRILVKYGLEKLRNTNLPGLKALAAASSTDMLKINSGTIAFRLSPRINAAGRMGEELLGLELLTHNDISDADEVAKKLNQMNSERQAIERKILFEAEEMLGTLPPENSSIVLASQNWNPGIIGIVASKLAEKHRKPAVIISIGGDAARGSVRSTGNFNVLKSIIACSRLLRNYGGHKAAAGFDISPDDINEFSEHFERDVSNRLDARDRIITTLIDAEIDISALNKKLIDELELLSPFGEENPKPTISINNCNIKNKKIVGSNHLKIILTDGDHEINTIGFGMGDRQINEGTKYRAAGTPQINDWNGTSSIQFKLIDIQEGGCNR